MVDIEAAITYPLEDDDWVKTIGIGGGILFANGVITFFGTIIAFILSLVLIGLLLFPLIAVISFIITLPVLGYGIRVLRFTIDGKDVPPRFKDWGALARDGLYAIAIALIYTLPLIVISIVLGIVFFLFAILMGGAASAGGGDAFAAGGSLLFIIGQFVFFGVVTLYSLAMIYVVPISLAIFAHEDDLRAAFSLDRIKQVGLTSEFAIPWLIAVIGAGIINQIAGFLVLLIVGFFLQFYIMVVVFRLFGEGYVDAMDLGDVSAGDEGFDSPGDETPPAETDESEPESPVYTPSTTTRDDSDPDFVEESDSDATNEDSESGDDETPST